MRKFSEWAKAARAQVVNNPDWDQSPIIADRLTWEVARFADRDAIIVHEAGSVALHSFEFDPAGGGGSCSSITARTWLGRRHGGGRQASRDPISR